MECPECGENPMQCKLRHPYSPRYCKKCGHECDPFKRLRERGNQEIRDMIRQL